MKAVLISIQTKWCALIANGEKTIEVRKTAPKLETPFKCLIYQTKTKDNAIYKRFKVDDMRNGKVIGEFVCDYIYDYFPVITTERYFMPLSHLYKACLSKKQLWDYGNQRTVFGWHISDLKIYDKPKELGEIAVRGIKKQNGNLIFWDGYLSKPPQSWRYIDVDEVDE